MAVDKVRERHQCFFAVDHHGSEGNMDATSDEFDDLLLRSIIKQSDVLLLSSR